MNSTHPRRRPTTSSTTASTASPSLFKASTFASSHLPLASHDAPVIHVPSLPSRSITCPKSIEELVASHEQRVTDVIDAFDRSFSGLVSTATAASKTLRDLLPISKFGRGPVDFLCSSNGADSGLDLNDLKKHTVSSIDDSRHAVDSGIGSSLSESDSEHLQYMMGRSRNSMELTACTLQSCADTSATDTKIQSNIQTRSRTAAAGKTECAGTTSNAAIDDNASFGNHHLRAYATKQIKKHIINPILANAALKNYHSLVKRLPQRISDRAITCLRDIEKTLIFCAPVSIDPVSGRGVLAYIFVLDQSKSDSHKSYLAFCEASIQCIHITVSHLNDLDQKRPADRPYTNRYFVDLVQQVRQYARVMAGSRSKEAAGESLDEMDHQSSVACLGLAVFVEPRLISASGDELQVQNTPGKSIELVRRKVDGKSIALPTTTMIHNATDDNVMADDDAQRSMARKRKCDQGKEELHSCRECGKQYKRPCDLNKHEKTHSRPWKCTDATCKYYDEGWPTEKERDRHVNDKHSSQPTLYKCLYSPCPYGSKRESNCKQHMEKAHGWGYVRSKTTKSQKAPVAASQLPATSTPPSDSTSALFSPCENAVHSPSDISSVLGGQSPIYTTHSSMFEPTQSCGGSNGLLGQSEAFLNTADTNNYFASYELHELPSCTLVENDLTSFVPRALPSHRESVSTPDLSHYSVGSPETLLNNYDDTFMSDIPFTDPTANIWPGFIDPFGNFIDMQTARPDLPELDFSTTTWDNGNPSKPVQRQGTAILPNMTPGAHDSTLFSPSVPYHSQLYAFAGDDFGDVSLDSHNVSHDGAKHDSTMDFTLFADDLYIGFSGSEASGSGVSGAAVPHTSAFAQPHCDGTTPLLADIPALDGESEMGLFTKIGEI